MRACRLTLSVAAISLGLLACGGGGGSETATVSPVQPVSPVSPVSYPAAATLAGQCEVPRTGLNPGTGGFYVDVQGSKDTEKAWVRSWINDTYLWYAEVPDVPASGFASATDYFSVLKTSATTASGAAKDKFHFTYLTPDWVALSQSGIQVGYGIDWVLLSSKPPRSIVVSQVTPGSVAAAAGVQRGTTVLAVDGVDLVNGTDVATLNSGLFPSVSGQTHSLLIKDPGAAATRTVSLKSGAVTSVPVQNVKVIESNGTSVGYLLFNDHIATAEQLLVNAVSQLQASKVSDLVLDVRYNGGGYLDIASQLAYMIAGPSTTQGKVFEQLVFNDKNPFNQSAADTRTPFHAQTLGFSVPKGQALPYLGLKRVYVLTSARTCSASESIVNGLRGAGVEVNVVGGATCGKPYGFIPQDNCGVTYFAIQFKGVNHLGFGDYADGLAPTCAAADDYTKALGDPTEGQLAVALKLRGDGLCPSVAPATSVAKATTLGTGVALTLPDNPARQNKLLR